MDNPALLSLRNLSFGYDPKRPLFVDARLDIFPQERLQVVGPNGIGKTTLLKIMSGLMPETGFSCQTYWKGNLSSLTQVRKNIAFVLDEPQLFVSLSGYENIEIFRLLWKSSNDYTTSVQSLCESFGIGNDLLGRPVKDYSLGTQHKLFLAMVVCCSAELCLMDEPFNTLDINSRNALVDWITNHPKRTFLIISHLSPEGLEFTKTLNVADLAAASIDSTKCSG